ncbi:mechanosensitive ion channel domain-containing protein [Aliikangiella sp. IMCC44653]
MFENFIAVLLQFSPSILTLIIVVLVVSVAKKLLLNRSPEMGSEKKFPRQMVMLGIFLAGVIALVLSLPIEESSKNQLIGLIGVLVSGLIAFSSTAAVANITAGIVLRFTQPFKTGDFISVGEHFGRVSERGLIDTEIQSENRELIALPNSYLMNNPIKAVHADGTIISTKLSIGYDVHHTEVEAALLKAAENCGLSDAFVHILELGDFSVVYRVSGLLPEVKGLISARSKLCASVLDALHDVQIEIMSPNFVNQRRFEVAEKVIPRRKLKTVIEETNVAEDIVFDKAEQAQKTEEQQQRLNQQIAALEEQLKLLPSESQQRVEKQIEKLKLKLEAIDIAQSKKD